METKEKKNVNLFALLDLIKPILFRVLKLIYIPAVVALLVGFYTFTQEKKKDTIFSADLNYLLEDEVVSEGGGGGSSASGQLLAAMTGGGGGGGGNKALMIDLSLSMKLIEQTLLSTHVIDGKEIVLANYYADNFGYRNAWKGSKELEKFIFSPEYTIGKNETVDRELRGMSARIKMDLKAKLNESGIIVMSFSSINEKFTKSFLDRHLITVSEFYTNKRVERSLNMIKFASRKRDSLAALLSGKEFGMAANQDKNGFGLVKKVVMAGELQIKRDINILSMQYNESVMALHNAKVDYERRKPFISVVDDIRFPLDMSSNNAVKKSLSIAIILFLGLTVLTGFILYGLTLLKQQREEYLNTQK